MSVLLVLWGVLATGSIEVAPCTGQPCPPGYFQLSRQAVEHCYTIAQAEAECRRALKDIPQPLPPPGWRPAHVLIIGAAIVFAVAAGAFAAGMVVGR